MILVKVTTPKTTSFVECEYKGDAIKLIKETAEKGHTWYVYWGTEEYQKSMFLDAGLTLETDIDKAIKLFQMVYNNPEVKEITFNSAWGVGFPKVFPGQVAKTINSKKEKTLIVGVKEGNVIFTEAVFVKTSSGDLLEIAFSKPPGSKYFLHTTKPRYIQMMEFLAEYSNLECI